MSQALTIVIAGATGLVGHSTLLNALNNNHVKQLYSLSRRRIKKQHDKLTQWLHPELNPPLLDTITERPTVGVIALGTTIKQAGSKAKLHAIDVELVTHVAQHMHVLGVQHIIIVSCLGASKTALSHYLRCKGEMEDAVQRLHFQKTTFLQPGPLAGHREKQRSDEKWLQSVMKILSPLMLGKLSNYKPIDAGDVAKAIIQLATEPHETQQEKVQRITSSQMMALINRYR